MADRKTITVAPGVTREDSCFGYTLTGTKEALLASGLAQEVWFWNGRRDSLGRRLTTVHFKIGANRAQCYPNSYVEGEYIINVNYPKEEAQKRRNEKERRRAPADAKNLLEFGVVNIIHAFNVANNPEWAWQFPAETIKQLKTPLSEIWRLFERGFKVRPGQPPDGNAEFQRFMRRTMGASPNSADGA